MSDASPSTPFLFTPGISSISAEEKVNDDEIPLDELYRDAEEESKRLKRAMVEYESLSATKKEPKTLQLSQNIKSWGDVLAEMERATAQYNDPHGISGKIRKWFRKSSEKADAVNAWLVLVPSQSEYFSVMCGGLQLILGAASRMNDLRDDIARALMEIPTLLSCTNRDLNLYKGSKDLHRCSSELFVAAIALIEHILRYYHAKRSKKLLGALFGQGVYERALSDKIEMLKLKSENFSRIADSCGREALEDARNKLEGLRKNAQQNHTETNMHLNASRMEGYAQYRLLRDQNEQLVKHLVFIQQLVGDFSAFLSSNQRLDPKTQDFRGPMLPLKKAISDSALRRSRDAAKQDTLTKLSFEESAVQSDIQKNLRNVYLLPRTTQDRVISTIRHHLFQEWLVQPNSSILYLNANNATAVPSRQSPTSFVCAKLISAIQSASQEVSSVPSDISFRTIAISFFCAEHMELHDSHSSAVQIIQSLLAQLLVEYQGFDPNMFLELRDAQLDDINVLCDCFEALVSQLPPETILFCIIDAITLHEESETRRANVELFLARLSILVNDNSGEQCRFKVLLTSPRVSRRFWKRMGQDNVMTLPEKIPSQGGFTAAKWNNHMRNANQSFFL